MKANNKRGKLYIEPRLAHTLDLMIKRMKTKRDVVLLVDGNEGDGKSNITSMVCSYVAEKTGRKYTVDNVFFDINKMVDFAKKGEKKIIHWDEGALGGLASDWWNKNQKLFVKLLMVARKKQHFFVICIPKFYKLNEYLACDRSIGLIHVYSADNLERGRFTYYNDAKKDILYDDWKRKHRKSYKMKYNFHGKFPDCLKYLIDEEAYEKKKDEAIEQLNKPPEKPTHEYRDRLERTFATLPEKLGKTVTEVAELIGYNRRTLTKFREKHKISAKKGVSLEIERDSEPDLITNVDKGEQILTKTS